MEAQWSVWKNRLPFYAALFWIASVTYVIVGQYTKDRSTTCCNYWITYILFFIMGGVLWYRPKPIKRKMSEFEILMELQHR